MEKEERILDKKERNRYRGKKEECIETRGKIEVKKKDCRKWSEEKGL